MARTISAIDEFRFRGNEEPWFRGTGDQNRGLTPSLFRQELTEDQSWFIEYDTYFEFRARAQEVHAPGVDGWDVLFYMQHHGVPTRLLDWTDTLMTAVFMALDSTEEGDAWVHILNPYALNETEVNERDVVAPDFILGWYTPEADGYEQLISRPGRWGFNILALYPSHKSARQRAQRGVFTFHGDVPTDLGDFPRKARFLRTIKIEREAHPAARYALWLAGIDRYLIYPELPSLGRAISEKYRLGKRFAVERSKERQAQRSRNKRS